MNRDPLAITRGLAVTDRALRVAGFDEEQRLSIWSGSARALVEQAAATGADIGLADLVVPGIYLLLEGRDGGLERAEVGVPHVITGPESLRVPLRRFGTEVWDIDGGSWAIGWSRKVRDRLVAPADWDEADDRERVLARIAGTFDQVWIHDRWILLAWWHARPGWVEEVFPLCHTFMKRGLRQALSEINGSHGIRFVPILAASGKLEVINSRNLLQPQSALFAPCEAGYRAFVENVRAQRVPRSTAMSMAFSWWARIYDEGAP